MHFVGIEGSYKSFDIALYHDATCVDSVHSTDARASAHFLITLKNLLEKNHKKLSDITFLAVNHGPGAFTSLRVILSAINAVGFSQTPKLVSVDGLDALERETGAIPLLNAYNNDVYYAVHGERGYKKIDVLLAELAQKYQNKKITLAGNGAHLHHALIKETLPAAEILSQNTCSAQQVALLGLEHWNRGERIVDELRPAYLKEQTYAVR